GERRARTAETEAELHAGLIRGVERDGRSAGGERQRGGENESPESHGLSIAPGTGAGWLEKACGRSAAQAFLKAASTRSNISWISASVITSGGDSARLAPTGTARTMTPQSS